MSLDEIKDHLSHKDVAIVLVDCNLLHCIRCHKIRSAIGVGMHFLQLLQLFTFSVCFYSVVVYKFIVHSAQAYVVDYFNFSTNIDVFHIWLQVLYTM